MLDNANKVGKTGRPTMPLLVVAVAVALYLCTPSTIAEVLTSNSSSADTSNTTTNQCCVELASIGLRPGAPGGLPLVLIDTHGKNITDVSRVKAHMCTCGSPGSELNGTVEIQVRGSSSARESVKKSFSFKLATSKADDGQPGGSEQGFMGFPPGDTFVLYGPEHDRAMIRNVLAMWIANSQGRYASRTQFCEVVLVQDGLPLSPSHYWGLYVAMEKIERNKNRVDVRALTPMNGVHTGNYTGNYTGHHTGKHTKRAPSSLIASTVTGNVSQAAGPHEAKQPVAVTAAGDSNSAPGANLPNLPLRRLHAAASMLHGGDEGEALGGGGVRKLRQQLSGGANKVAYVYESTAQHSGDNAANTADAENQSMLSNGGHATSDYEDGGGEGIDRFMAMLQQNSSSTPAADGNAPQTTGNRRLLNSVTESVIVAGGAAMLVTEPSNWGPGYPPMQQDPPAGPPANSSNSTRNSAPTNNNSTSARTSSTLTGSTASTPMGTAGSPLVNSTGRRLHATADGDLNIKDDMVLGDRNGRQLKQSYNSVIAAGMAATMVANAPQNPPVNGQTYQRPPPTSSPYWSDRMAQDTRNKVTGGYIIRFEHGKDQNTSVDFTAGLANISNVSGIIRPLPYILAYPNLQSSKWTGANLENPLRLQQLAAFRAKVLHYISTYMGDVELAFLQSLPQSRQVQLPLSSMDGPSVAALSGRWQELVDEPAFIDYMIGTELTKNPDGYRGSIYMSKDRGGKLFMGPMWDYDEAFGMCCGYPIQGFDKEGNSTGSSGGSAISPEGWRFNICEEPARCVEDPVDGLSLWYRAAWRDPDFRISASNRWASLRQGNLSDARINEKLASTLAYIEPAAIRNYQRWDAVLASPYFVNGTDQFHWQVQSLSTWLVAHAAWLDQAFAQAAVATNSSVRAQAGGNSTMEAEAEANNTMQPLVQQSGGLP